MTYHHKIVFCIFQSVYSLYIKLIFLINNRYPKLLKAITKFMFDSMDITINGSESTDIKILKPDEFYAHTVAYFDLGLYECFINEACTTEDLRGLYHKICISKYYPYFLHPIRFVYSMLNLQTGDNIWKVADVHYDKASEVIEAMLDENMQYTCGYWRNATNLNDAQIAKMDLIAAKLHLKPGMRVLELGCGYGTLACYLAKKYGVSVVGCTISKEQVKYGKAVAEGLPVELHLRDYREMDGVYDRVIAIGLTEHVGSKNLKALMKVAHKCLKDDGLFLIHTIGMNHKSKPRTSALVNTHIFPNSEFPYYLDILKATEGLFIIEDWQNFGVYYCNTLNAWDEKFEKSWPQLKNKYTDKFYRMWKGYLALAWALFHTRSIQLWQIVLSKNGLEGGYISIH